MKVLLAGYNLDAAVIEDLKQGNIKKDNITPEVLSASYARISRDPRPIDELRADARREIEKARKSNQNIIFKMGHHSVAEHAVFNFDVIGISRLALEELEKFRLCSYTEKSQRYQKLEGSFYLPEEIKNKNIFEQTIDKQNKFYEKMKQKGIESEDARYITSLSTLGQVGITLNARNLELMFRRFASSPLGEIQTLGRKMYDQIKDIAPSIILFTSANKLDRDTYNEIKQKAKKQKNIKSREVELVDFTKNADLKILAALLHTTSNASYLSCLKTAKTLSKNNKLELFKTALKNVEFYDAVLREFEYADLLFDLNISAACFGQLKRHRMATVTSQLYDPELGITTPSTVLAAGLKKDFENVAKETERAFYTLAKENHLAASYILTNAHRKRVLFKCNARELYHLSRLREDKHAQWDIQNISRIMSEKAKGKMPLTMLTIGGKDAYPCIYEKVFGKKLKILPQY
ncbi:MAG: thymidylate synthase [Candidatus Saganbacteria bacterium]|uniref:Thymidylate synthase n=1 Tax=Candidatus Saganbacteria bacterium TaxID=2575572 RepID=A0A833NZN4_UNCSA|nr:MAG: thymidylate synthase [Candidatus Saganbacteria bacterium]